VNRIIGVRPALFERVPSCRTMPRLLVFVTSSALLASLVTLAGGSAVASGAAYAAKGATCKQITKGDVQPLIAGTITKVKISAANLPGAVPAQVCEYSSAGGVVDVTVVKSSTSKQLFKQDVAGFDHKVVVHGVTGKAYRPTGDFQMEALNGDVDCSVTTEDAATIPGVSALQSNGDSDGDFQLSESDNSIIATALGTICNRLFKKGNTKPSLAGLQ
jgi:hypothetical protein